MSPEVEKADAAAAACEDYGVSDEETPLTGWKHELTENSLPESFRSVPYPAADAAGWRKLLAFSGLGFVISVGYMDPGNWATDISAGSQFGYQLLCAVLLSSIMAMFLQHLALKLGIAAERDLAQACRDAYPRYVNICLWILAEIAIAACDLAEVIGSAVAINLLFGLPLWAGVLITAADVIIVLIFELKNFRFLELFIVLLVATIAGCFIYELSVARPHWPKVFEGFIPKPVVLTNSEMLYAAIGILGATVMPHNLYLHSSIVQTRAYPRSSNGKSVAIHYGTIDSSISLFLSFFINASILILAAASFHYGTVQRTDVADITDAYMLLTDALGTKAASILFGVALLASGQNATITGTLAGQIVMEGFLKLRMKPWARRVLTRSIALVPALVCAAVLGARGVGRLLVLSQVILSLQLSFAVVPLVHFTSCKAYVGKWANGWGLTITVSIMALLIAGLNGYLLIQTFLGEGLNAA